jgi:DNA invertase Pin-like site-specific DNA recombinase
MKPAVPKPRRCAIYTRKSTEHNLDLEFNSLDAQREACEAYIKSQAHEGWRLVPDRYDDGGLSGASLDRPALQKLLADVRADKITIVVVYKVDRLTRSLADFAKLVELFDQQGVSFVSITQSFNTTSSMGRLTLNVLLSFAQFEREVIGERVRDKIAASKRKGLWVGGPVPLGYRCIDKKLEIVPEEAQNTRTFRLTRARPLFGRPGTKSAPAALDLTAAGNCIELRAAAAMPDGLLTTSLCQVVGNTPLARQDNFDTVGEALWDKTRSGSIFLLPHDL